jgi:hypothetical protein
MSTATRCAKREENRTSIDFAAGVVAYVTMAPGISIPLSAAITLPTGLCLELGGDSLESVSSLMQSRAADGAECMHGQVQS